MEAQMNRQVKGMAVLGFFLTILMIFSLITGGVLISVKTTILNGGDIDEILENTNVYETLTDAFVSELSSDTAGTGLSKEAVETVFSEEILKGAAQTVTNAMRNDKDIDLSGVKNECMDIVTEVSEQAVEDIFDEIKNTSDVVSTDVLKQNQIIQQLEKDYNVDVTTVISDYVQDTYGSTTVNVSDIDVDKVKTEAKEALKETVIPTIEKTVDDCIEEVNARVNEQIREVNKEYDIPGAINQIEGFLGIMTIFIMFTIALSIVFAVVQIAAIYRGRTHRGFRNVSVAAFVSGIVVVLVGIIFNILNSAVMENVGENPDAVERAVGDFMETNIGAIGSRAVTIGVLYILLAAACMVAAIVMKKKYSEKNGYSIVIK